MPRVDTQTSRIRPNLHSVPEPEAKQQKIYAKSSPAAGQNIDGMQLIFEQNIFEPQVLKAGTFLKSIFQQQPSQKDTSDTGPIQTIFNREVFPTQGQDFRPDSVEIDAWNGQPSLSRIQGQQSYEELCRTIGLLSIDAPGKPQGFFPEDFSSSAPKNPRSLHLQITKIYKTGLIERPDLATRIDEVINTIIHYKSAIERSKDQEEIKKIIEQVLCYAHEVEKANIPQFHSIEIIYRLIGEHIPLFFSYLKIYEIEINF